MSRGEGGIFGEGGEGGREDDNMRSALIAVEKAHNL